MECTKGDWKREGLSIHVFGAGTIAITPTVEDGGVFERVANAQLIASAPDLYEACMKARAWLMLDEHISAQRVVLDLEQALAKAEGNVV